MTESRTTPPWHRSAKMGRKAPRHALTTLPGCISEIARVYRAFKRGDITADVARTRTYILDKLRAGLEAQTLADLEDRLNEAEANGRVSENRPNGQALMAH